MCFRFDDSDPTRRINFTGARRLQEALYTLLATNGLGFGAKYDLIVQRTDTNELAHYATMLTAGCQYWSYDSKSQLRAITINFPVFCFHVLRCILEEHLYECVRAPVRVCWCQFVTGIKAASPATKWRASIEPFISLLTKLVASYIHRCQQWQHERWHAPHPQSQQHLELRRRRMWKCPPTGNKSSLSVFKTAPCSALSPDEGKYLLMR